MSESIVNVLLVKKTDVRDGVAENGDNGRSKAINVTGPDGAEPQGAPFQGGY